MKKKLCKLCRAVAIVSSVAGIASSLACKDWLSLTVNACVLGAVV